MSKKSRILIVSNTEDAHASAVHERLADRQIPVYRLNSDTLYVSDEQWRISAGNDQDSFSSWHIPDISTVWYRKVWFQKSRSVAEEFVREEMSGLLDGILAGYRDCFWVNRRDSAMVARSKLGQLKLAKDIGFRIPDTLITTDVSALKDFFVRHNEQIVAKPIQAQVVGSDEEALVVGTRRLVPEFFAASVEQTPCFAQERLQISSEIRVVAFGEKLYSFRLTSKRAQMT